MKYNRYGLTELPAVFLGIWRNFGYAAVLGLEMIRRAFE